MDHEQFDNLHSSVKVSSTANNQLLFSSQSYGTNYFIYGHFTTEENTDTSCKITGIHIEMLNYKGILNLGFPTIDAQKTRVYPVQEEGKDPYIQVDIFVQAVAAGTTATTYKDDITLTTPFTVSHRTNLRVARKLIPLAGEGTNTALVNGVFDDEFYYRDGHDYARRVVREISDEANEFEVFNLSDQMSPLTPTGPGYKCRDAYFQLVFK